MQKLFNSFIFFVVLALVAVGAMWLVLSRSSMSVSEPDSNRLSIVASFYPIAEFARQVGGELVSVSTITPAGAEPHDYEPSTQQIASAYDADVFLYNGEGVDAWAERIAPDVSDGGVTVAKMSEAIDVMPGDPHFWLDPVLAEREVDAIRDALIAADPAHASIYAKNADAYNAELTLLDQDYKTDLETCSTRTIITSHAAFAYLAREYALNVVAVTGISPEEEPSAQRIAEIADLARQENIKYIYFETLVSPKLSETIAHEIGAGTLVFNPIEGLSDDEIASGKNYLTVMRENLQNLETGMGCK